MTILPHIFNRDHDLLHNWMMPYFPQDGVFSEAELDDMQQNFPRFEGAGWDYKQAEVGYIPGNVNTTIRSSKVKYIQHTDGVDWLFARMDEIADRLNRQVYGAKVTSYGAMQYTEYGPGDEYVEHMDLQMGVDCSKWGIRKLSVILMISDPEKDFKGGEFEYRDGVNMLPIEFKRGRLVMMPSFVSHRVRPVTEGLRQSLVFWLTGPKVW